MQGARRRSGGPELVRCHVRQIPGTAPGQQRLLIHSIPTRLTRIAKPNPRSRNLWKGPYGIRTRAAAVRGRCPRPLDEWAVAREKGSETAEGPRRSESRPEYGLERGFGLARVQARLEVSPDALAVRQHGFVAHSARRELHDADVLVAVAVAARVRGSLIEGPKAVALPLSPHVARHLPEGHGRRNPRRELGAAVCDENLAT